MKTFLALDLGTKCGYCLGTKAAQVSGTAVFSHDRYSGGGMRFLRFKNWLNELSAEEVVFEEVRRHRGTDAAHVYGGLLATLTSWCEENKIPYQGVPVGTIKKFATGKGNANKDAMIESVRSWGFEPVDDNEADAIAIFRWRIEQEHSA